MAWTKRGKFAISASLNPDLPEEAEMIKVLKRKKSYSKYLKKLIADDIAATGGREVKAAKTPTPPAESSQYESPEVPQQYSNESPEIPEYYEKPRKKPARPPQAESSYSTHQHSPIPSQYIPPKPPTDPRNGPLINPKPRRY